MFVQPMPAAGAAGSPFTFPDDKRRSAPAAPRWLTWLVLGAACALLVALAVIAAVLSFHAQADYVYAHDGRSRDRALAWAVLLDAATAGVSLLRLHDALTRRSAAISRTVLAACIAVSVAMNLAHTGSPTPGGYLVAAVPPLLYATLLEMLLAKLRSMLVGAPQPTLAPALRRAVVALHFPAPVWRAWRTHLRRQVPAPQRAGAVQHADPHGSGAPTRRHGSVERDTGAGTARPRNGAPTAHAEPTGAAQLPLGDGAPPRAQRTTRTLPHRERSSRRMGAKRAAFEAALVAQVRRGDVRVLSGNARLRNRAAYDAAGAMAPPLSAGAARRYVVEALPRVREAALRTSEGGVARFVTEHLG